MNDQITIGARLRALRRWRGMTLAELGDQAELSISFLSMAERGQRSLDRRSHIAALAAALRISETDLVGGPHLTADPVQSDPHLAIPGIRAALLTNTLISAASERARPLGELITALGDEIEPARRIGAYVPIGDALPGVIDELYVHATAATGEDTRQHALEGLVEACTCAAAITKELGYVDLAALAATRSGEAAAALSDPVQQGKAAFMQIMTVPRVGTWDRALIAAERAASALEPHAADPAGLQALGMLALAAAMTAAASKRRDSAKQWLKEAEKIADRVSDDPTGNWQQFSMTNVRIWEVAIAVEHGERGGRVQELAQRVNDDRLEASSIRRASLYADVGRGLARDRRTHDEAVRWLRQAEGVSPQRIRNSGPVRDTVEVLLERSVGNGRELRGMAARMGIPH